MQNLELNDLIQVSGGQDFSEYSADAINAAIEAALQNTGTTTEYSTEVLVDPTIFEMKAYLMPDGTWVMWCGGPPPPGWPGEIVDPVYPEIDIGEIYVPYPYGFGACV